MVKTYLDNTKGSSGWSYNRLELIDAFKIERHGEAERYNPNGYGNKMLLWHGSRFSNFVGILSQGLRIAPAEAPKTGYNFDKGVYLASMAEKSSAYCCANISNNVGLLLLCEAALGNTKVYSSFYEDAANLPKGCHSTHGMGTRTPDPSKSVKLDGDITVPSGPVINNPDSRAGIGHDEYVVYNVNQVKIRYLLKVKFN